MVTCALRGTFLYLTVVCTESHDCIPIGADDAEIEDEELEGVAAESTEQEFSFTEFVLR